MLDTHGPSVDPIFSQICREANTRALWESRLMRTSKHLITSWPPSHFDSIQTETPNRDASWEYSAARQWTDHDYLMAEQRDLSWAERRLE